MMRFLAFLVKNDIWILFLCVLGILWYIRQLAGSRRILYRSTFTMERDRAFNERNVALFWLFLFGSIMAGVIYVNTNLINTIPRQFLDPPTSTPDLIATQLVTPTFVITPRAELPTSTPILAPTATLRDAGSFNIVQQQSAPTRPPPLEVEPLVEGCGAAANILAPSSGQTLIGGVSLFGRAAAENFAFYRIEVTGPQTNDQWQSLVAGTISTPVEDGFLGSADFAGWTTGVYQVRLTVVSTDNADIESCLIQIGVNP